MYLGSNLSLEKSFFYKIYKQRKKTNRTFGQRIKVRREQRESSSKVAVTFPLSLNPRPLPQNFAIQRNVEAVYSSILWLMHNMNVTRNINVKRSINVEGDIISLQIVIT